MTTVIFVAQVNIGLKVVLKESSQGLPKEAWKRQSTASGGLGIVGERSNKVSHKCINCAKVTAKAFQCSRCKASLCCSLECQQSHWGQHEPLCSAIKQLEEQNIRSNHSQTIFATHVTPRKHLQIVKLVGERCVVPCLINGNEVNVLYDTGAQVSMISHDWMRRNLIDYELKKHGTQIPYTGYVDVNLRLKSNDHELVVPMLVSKNNIDLPIIGNNIIQEITRNTVSGQTLLNAVKVLKILSLVQLLRNF